GGFSPRWEGYCILRSIALSSFLATASQPQKLLVLYSGAKQGGGFAFWVSVDSIRRMTPEELFTAALGLGRQWQVVECRFEGEPKRLELRLEHVRGQRFACPQCGNLCGVHDTIERRWRHYELFPVPLRTGGQGAAHLVSHRRGASGAGALGPGRQRFHPDDGSPHDGAQ